MSDANNAPETEPDFERHTHRTFYTLQAKEAVFEYKDEQGDQQTVNKVIGVFSGLTVFYDEGNAKANVNAGWRLKIGLEDALITVKAPVYIYNCAPILAMAAKGETLWVGAHKGTKPVSFPRIARKRPGGGWEVLFVGKDSKKDERDDATKLKDGVEMLKKHPAFYGAA